MRQSVKLVACLSALFLLVSPVAAGLSLSVDVLWQPKEDDDVQVFLHASNTAYPMPREHVTAVFRKMSHPERDYPILAFIAHHARVDIRTVWAYRSKGHPWFDVMLHFGVGPDVLFVRLDDDPGPPYGKAYGHWRKHHNRMPARFVTDEDVQFWVGLHTVAAYSGTSVAHVHKRFAAGEKIRHLAGKHYRVKHAKAVKHHKKHRDRGASGKGHGKKKH